MCGSTIRIFMFPLPFPDCHYSEWNSFAIRHQNRSLADEQLHDSIVDTLVSALPLMSVKIQRQKLCRVSWKTRASFGKLVVLGGRSGAKTNGSH